MNPTISLPAQAERDLEDLRMKLMADMRFSYISQRERVDSNLRTIGNYFGKDSMAAAADALKDHGSYGADVLSSALEDVAKSGKEDKKQNAVLCVYKMMSSPEGISAINKINSGLSALNGGTYSSRFYAAVECARSFLKYYIGEVYEAACFTDSVDISNFFNRIALRELEEFAEGFSKASGANDFSEKTENNNSESDLPRDFQVKLIMPNQTEIKVEVKEDGTPTVTESGNYRQPWYIKK